MQILITIKQKKKKMGDIRNAYTRKVLFNFSTVTHAQNAFEMMFAYFCGLIAYLAEICSGINFFFCAIIKCSAIWAIIFLIKNSKNSLEE